MKRTIITLIILTLFLSTTSFAKETLLRLGMQDEPKTLNPLKATDVWSWNVIGWFSESLYTREPITHKIIPWIADGYPEYGERSAIVRLRKGVMWEDKSELTAYDVKFTADIMLKFKIPRYYGSWEFIEKVEVLDRYTVVLFKA